MHLGLIRGPFVHHNLISSQESPVPLPKFQMAPRLKILMSSWSKKGTQLYCPFLSKDATSFSPPFPQRGHYGERCPYPYPFLTSIYFRVALNVGNSWIAEDKFGCSKGDCCWWLVT
jgi:hypothetical protein